MTFRTRWTHLKSFAVVAVAAVAVGAWVAGAGSTQTADAAQLSPVEKLVAQSEIEQQIRLYTLLFDGDGVAKQDIRQWADRMFTEDAVFDTYGADGQLRSRLKGREDIFTKSGAAQPTPSPDIAVRHFNVATYFDEVTPTTAKVRTIATMLSVTKRKPEGCAKVGDEACGGRAVRVTAFTYHDTFAKTPDGWKKSYSIIRSDL